MPDNQVANACKLDPNLLKTADRTIGAPYIIVRYGKLCHQYLPNGTDRASEVYSTTKSLGGAVTGAVAYETRNMNRTGRKTGPLSDVDRVDHWLDRFSYNDDALIAHVLAMVAHNRSLTNGRMTYEYDTVGSVQINSLSDIINTAIAQDSSRLGRNIDEFTKRFVFNPLGMTNSTWSNGSSNKTFAYTWSTTMHDMARLGLMILHRGTYNGKRVMSEGWAYRMTHPAFEEANTAYGYLTWLNSRGGGTGPGGAGTGTDGDTCAPAALWNSYPHYPSTYPNCKASLGNNCNQVNDMGVWSAQGMGGQFIVGHPGLDLLIVAKNFSGGDGPTGLWKAIRPALVALDPVYKGNESSFCSAYAATTYAPDMPTQPKP